MAQSGLREDSSIVGWGGWNNKGGQATAPPGSNYTQVSAGGVATAWPSVKMARWWHGGVLMILGGPPLSPGSNYTQVSAGGCHNLAPGRWQHCGMGGME
ncbi:hypothetical protein [Methanogenium cariaci]|uniref:hypothetical protein n=1 Tax=Methanogenium cariaci TaxID=2197 RepID=UPI0007852E3C|nr:hypothetical protein [Methanogenium cariaci]